MHQVFDLVLLVVKAYDTRWHAELIKPYLADDGFLIGVQNGMTAEIIADVVGPVAHARLRGRAVVLVLRSRRDQAQHGAAEDLVRARQLPRLDAQGREEAVAAILRHAGKVDLVDDVLAAKFMKLVVNSMTLGTMAMIGGDLADAQPDGMRELMMRLGTEALVVGSRRSAIRSCRSSA